MGIANTAAASAASELLDQANRRLEAIQEKISDVRGYHQYFKKLGEYIDSRSVIPIPDIQEPSLYSEMRQAQLDLFGKHFGSYAAVGEVVAYIEKGDAVKSTVSKLVLSLQENVWQIFQGQTLDDLISNIGRIGTDFSLPRGASEGYRKAVKELMSEMADMEMLKAHFSFVNVYAQRVSADAAGAGSLTKYTLGILKKSDVKTAVENWVNTTKQLRDDATAMLGITTSHTQHDVFSTKASLTAMWMQGEIEQPQEVPYDSTQLLLNAFSQIKQVIEMAKSSEEKDVAPYVANKMEYFKAFATVLLDVLPTAALLSDYTVTAFKVLDTGSLTNGQMYYELREQSNMSYLINWTANIALEHASIMTFVRAGETVSDDIKARAMRQIARGYCETQAHFIESYTAIATKCEEMGVMPISKVLKLEDLLREGNRGIASILTIAKSAFDADNSELLRIISVCNELLAEESDLRRMITDNVSILAVEIPLTEDMAIADFLKMENDTCCAAYNYTSLKERPVVDIYQSKPVDIGTPAKGDHVIDLGDRRVYNAQGQQLGESIIDLLQEGKK